jgi:hypothetical protein
MQAPASHACVAHGARQSPQRWWRHRCPAPARSHRSSLRHERALCGCLQQAPPSRTTGVWCHPRPPCLPACLPATTHPPSRLCPLCLGLPRSGWWRATTPSRLCCPLTTRRTTTTSSLARRGTSTRSQARKCSGEPAGPRAINRAFVARPLGPCPHTPHPRWAGGARRSSGQGKATRPCMQPPLQGRPTASW